MLKRLGILLMLCNLPGCSLPPVKPHAQRGPEVLFVFDDGKMLFRDRYLNQDDVVIYPDGYGGERAAVKVRVPVKPDYYRDSIRVERISSESMPAGNENLRSIN